MKEQIDFKDHKIGNIEAELARADEKWSREDHTK